MSKVLIENGSLFLERSIVAMHGFFARVEPVLIRRCRGWSLIALDKAITGLSIVLLAPAIFAVLIAIRRSASGKTGMGKSAAAADSNLRFPINPVLAGVGQRPVMTIVPERAMSA